MEPCGLFQREGECEVGDELGAGVRDADGDGGGGDGGGAAACGNQAEGGLAGLAHVVAPGGGYCVSELKLGCAETHCRAADDIELLLFHHDDRRLRILLRRGR